MIVYDEPRVALQPGSTPTVQAPVVHNYAGEQMQQGGAALTKAGAAVSTAAAELQDAVDTAAAKEADNKLADTIRGALYDPDNGYLQKSNKDALTALDPTRKGLESAISSLSSGLTNDRQREMFMRAAGARRQSALTQIDGHAANQAKAYNMNEAKSRADNAIKDALANGASWRERDGMFAKSKLLGATEIDALAGQAGIARGSEQYKALVQEYTTKLHTGMIDQMLATDQAKNAEEYFKAYRGEINPELYDEVTNKVGNAVAYVDGKEFGDRLYADATKGLSINAAVPVASMIKSVEESNLDTKAKEYAKGRVKELSQLYESQRSDNARAASNQIHGMMISGRSSHSQVVKTIKALGNVDDTAKASLMSAADSYYHISENQAAANMEAKMQQSLHNLSNLLQFQNDYASGRLGKIDPRNMGSYLSTFGSYTDTAMQFVNNANALATTAKLPLDDLKNELRIMKRNPAFKNLTTIPDPDVATPENKASLAILQSQVLSLMAASGSEGPGRQMSVQQALSKALQPVVTDRGFFHDTKTPLYKLGTTEAGDPKGWSNDAKTAFINSEFYKAHGRIPSAQEFKMLKLQLEK